MRSSKKSEDVDLIGFFKEKVENFTFGIFFDTALTAKPATVFD